MHLIVPLTLPPLGLFQSIVVYSPYPRDDVTWPWNLVWSVYSFHSLGHDVYGDMFLVASELVCVFRRLWMHDLYDRRMIVFGY